MRFTFKWSVRARVSWWFYVFNLSVWAFQRTLSNKQMWVRWRQFHPFSTAVMDPNTSHPVTSPCIVIHSLKLYESKPISLPPYVLILLPLFSMDLDLPFDPQPTWRPFHLRSAAGLCTGSLHSNDLWTRNPKYTHAKITKQIVVGINCFKVLKIKWLVAIY